MLSRYQQLLNAVQTPYQILFGAGNWSHIVLILFLLFFFFVIATSWKSLKLSRLNWIGMKFGKIVLRSKYHRQMESDFRFDATLSRWHPWHHFTHNSAATWWIQQRRQFLIHSTFAFICWRSLLICSANSISSVFYSNNITPLSRQMCCMWCHRPTHIQKSNSWVSCLKWSRPNSGTGLVKQKIISSRSRHSIFSVN